MNRVQLFSSLWEILGNMQFLSLHAAAMDGSFVTLCGLGIMHFLGCAIKGPLQSSPSVLWENMTCFLGLATRLLIIFWVSCMDFSDWSHSS